MLVPFRKNVAFARNNDECAVEPPPQESVRSGLSMILNDVSKWPKLKIEEQIRF